MLFFGLYTWLPSTAVERGWSGTAAGLLGAGVIASSLAGSLLMTPLPGGHTVTDRALVVSAVAAVAGCFGFVLLPDAAWLSTLIGGASTGALFVLSLRLPAEIGGGLDEISSLSALMLAVGYWAGALAPVVLGSLRDMTGAFSAGFLTLGLLSVLLLAVSLWFANARSRIG